MVAGGLIFLLLAPTGGGALSGRTKLVFSTASAEKLYDGFPLTASDWEIEGSLAKGHTAQVQITGSRSEAGESANTADLKILDESGADVTSLYEIQYRFGALTVRARTVTVVSGDASKVYDGAPLTAPYYTVADDGDGLAVGHKAQLTVTGEITEVGAASNTVSSARIVDTLGNDVTENYRLLLREGVLIVTGSAQAPVGPGGVSMDGNSDLLPAAGMTDAVLYSVYAETDGKIYLKVRSFGNYNGRGWEDAPAYSALLEERYSAACLTGLALTEAGQRARTLRIRSFCGNYAMPCYFDIGSGEAQTSDVLFSGNTDGVYDILYYDMVKDPSSLYTPYLNYEKEYRAFVYENYLQIDDASRAYMEALIAREGFSAKDPDAVSAVAAYIRGAGVYTRNYPAAMERERNVAIAFLETYRQGVCRHYASAAVLLYRALGIPARYTIGALAETKAGEWTDVRAISAHAWVEVYLDGVGWMQVEVTGSADGVHAVTVKPADAAYLYDGKGHVAPNTLVGLEEFEKNGYTYQAQIAGVRKELGVTETVITDLKIFNSLGKDVTFQFDVTLQTGILQIYADTVVVKSENERLVYGAIPSEPKVSYELSEGTEGLTVTASRETDLGVGRQQNLFEVRLLDASGADVTDLYRIERRYGSLLVEPAQITFKAGDASKVYDGEALTCGEIEAVSGALLEGHTVKNFEVSGSQKSVGRSESVITHVAIHDENGKNVTKNYAILLLPGRLTVTMK